MSKHYRIVEVTRNDGKLKFWIELGEGMLADLIEDWTRLSEWDSLVAAKALVSEKIKRDKRDAALAKSAADEKWNAEEKSSRVVG